jgi:LPPG:FO 2-phospho-L-lactate transferase
MAHGFELLGDIVATSVIVNTGDDLELHGLAISPDLDTVTYTLAGLANDQTGWGVRDETWSAAEMLERYGAETWFRLGDRDLATHLVRTAALRAGDGLTAVTGRIARALGVRARLLPMSDDPVRTKVRTSHGWLDFQDYFVRRRHSDDVLEVRFGGLADARPTPQVVDSLESAELVIIAPSNPFVSVAPILSLPGVLDALQSGAAPVVAVSPIVAGQAVRGPAAQMLSSIGGQPPTSVGVAAHYAMAYPSLVDILVLDQADATLAEAVERAGMRPLVTRTLIGANDDRRRLAAELLELVA